MHMQSLKVDSIKYYIIRVMSACITWRKVHNNLLVGKCKFGERIKLQVAAALGEMADSMYVIVYISLAH